MSLEDEIRAVVASKARTAFRQVLDFARRNVVLRTPRWRGGLRAGVAYEVGPDGLTGNVHSADTVTAHVFEANPAARWSSRMPPPSALEPWVADRLKVSASSPGPVTRGPRKGQPRRSPAWTLGFLIARKIRDRGTIPIPLRFAGSGVPSGMGMMFRRVAWLMVQQPREWARIFRLAYQRAGTSQTFPGF